MNAEPSIRAAGPDDARRLHQALAALARDLGVPERFHATPRDYARHGPGGDGLFRALLAEAAGADPVLGAATYFPEFSTLRGRPGVYLQDLWVAPEQRGSGLGRRLLATVVREAAAWGAAYMKLATHMTNADAVGFYRRLGFKTNPDEMSFLIEKAGYARLEGAR